MSAKEFKQLLDQIATPSSGSDPQWDAITNVVEIIKQREISAKKASQEIRKKLLEANESTVLQTLFLVDSVVKNTPSAIHKDFLTSELLGALKAIVEGQGPSMAKAVDKALEMLGEWKAAFGDDSAYKIIQTTFNDLEKGGYFIPEATLASASFMQKPPSFQEADKCFLCSKEFGKGLIKGRHHCRNCGKSICSKCTGETNVPLPSFGIKEPQRVCITCHKKLDKPSDSGTSDSSSNNTSNLPAEYLQFLGGGDNPSSSPTPPTVTGGAGPDRERQLQEEEELQMAIAMSLNEEENKKKTTSSSSSSSGGGGSKATPTTISSSPPAPVQSNYTPIYADLDFSTSSSSAPYTGSSRSGGMTQQQQDKDDELQRYLNFGKQRKEEQSIAPPTQQVESGSVPLCATLRNLINHFTQRMEGVNNRGTNVATDQATLTMHQDLTALNIQLLQLTDETQEKKAHMEAVLHKLNEAKEARVTLDTMRRRHQEQLLQQEREQAALVQMQMQMKLALLRQQKAEQLAYGQSMQAERLGRLSNQREEYERTLQSQREQERIRLIAQEEHVYQQQFGGGVGGTTLPDTNPYVLSSTHDPSATGYTPSMAGPLPQKVEPPPYQPLPSLYQPSSLYQPPPQLDEYSVPPSAIVPSVPSMDPSPPQQYAPPPSFATPMNPPPPVNIPSTYSTLPPTQHPANQMPLMTGLSSMAPPSILQRPPSEPPLISFD